MAGRNKHELKVGLFLIIPAALMLITITLKLGYSIAGSTMDVYLKVDSLSSVKEGTPVMVKGYTIGRIVDIRPVFQPELHFLATMRISSDIDLNDNCTVLIRNQNVLGDPSVEIFNSPEKSGPLMDGDVIEGISTVAINEIVKQVSDLLGNLNMTVSGVNSVLRDTRADFLSLTSSLTRSVGSLSVMLESSQKDVLEMLSSFRSTAKTMDEISLELKKHPVKFLFRDEKD